MAGHTSRENGTRGGRPRGPSPQTLAKRARLQRTRDLNAEAVEEQIRRGALFDVRRLFDARGNVRPIQELSEADAAMIEGFEVVKRNITSGDGETDIKRYLRTVAPRARSVGVFEVDPGQEGRVDFFRGAPTFEAATGQWKPPWVFRLTLSCSRHGYEEAVWDQQLETFLRLHERAFRDLAGVPTVVRLDNLKSGVQRACFYDPDVNEVYTAFARHWGFTPLPIQPRRPEENGKQERSGGYVKDNALKGSRFESLEAHNACLRHWNRTIARLRIHGTTRRQVWTHFREVEQSALRPLAADSFPMFRCGERGITAIGQLAGALGISLADFFAPFRQRPRQI